MKFNYRIIRIEKELKHDYVHNKKITMTKFYAKNDVEAYAYLKDYIKVANKAYTYYYESWNPIVHLDKNGKKHEYEDSFALWEAEDKEKGLFAKLKHFIEIDVGFWVIDKPKDLWYWLSNRWYLNRTKHNISESWSIDCHILDDIKWNIPILNKNCHGMAFPYLNKAVCETHKNDKNFNIDEWNKTNHEYTQEEERLALKYQEESRNELVKFIKLYEYYRDHGITDDKEFDSKWHHTLPIKKGTFDSFEYDKLAALQRKYWNKIWEWMRVYGESLWD